MTVTLALAFCLPLMLAYGRALVVHETVITQTNRLNSAVVVVCNIRKASTMKQGG